MFCHDLSEDQVDSKLGSILGLFEWHITISGSKGLKKPSICIVYLIGFENIENIVELKNSAKISQNLQVTSAIVQKFIEKEFI